MLVSQPGDFRSQNPCLGDQVEEWRERRLELDHECMVVRRREAFDLLHGRGQPAGLHLVADALEVLLHVLRRHGASVVKLDALAKVESVGQAVVRNCPALGEQALRAAILRNRRQRFGKRVRKRDRAGVTVKIRRIQRAPLQSEGAAIDGVGKSWGSAEQGGSRQQGEQYLFHYRLLSRISSGGGPARRRRTGED